MTQSSPSTRGVNARLFLTEGLGLKEEVVDAWLVQPDLPPEHRISIFQLRRIAEEHSAWTLAAVHERGWLDGPLNALFAISGVKEGRPDVVVAAVQVAGSADEFWHLTQAANVADIEAATQERLAA